MNTTSNSTNSQYPQNQKKFYGSGQFDKHRSTMRHICFMATGKEFDGYSCGKHSNEPQDKIYMLEGIMLRLFRSGYWNASKCECIEWYLQDIYGEKSNDELIVRTYPDRYEFGTCEKYIHNERLQNFLKRFYQAIKEKKVSEALRDRCIRTRHDDKFSISHRRFKTSAELMEYTQQLRKEGEEEGRIHDFTLKYREKYLLQA